MGGSGRTADSLVATVGLAKRLDIQLARPFGLSDHGNESNYHGTVMR